MATRAGWFVGGAGETQGEAGITEPSIRPVPVLRPTRSACREVQEALTKLGARDRAELIVTAYESGFVTRLAPHFVGVTVGFGLSVTLGFGDEETAGLGEGAAPGAGALRHR
jgi:hypothetical protein